MSSTSVLSCEYCDYTGVSVNALRLHVSRKHRGMTQGSKIRMINKELKKQNPIHIKKAVHHSRLITSPEVPLCDRLSNLQAWIKLFDSYNICPEFSSQTYEKASQNIVDIFSELYDKYKGHPSGTKKFLQIMCAPNGFIESQCTKWLEYHVPVITKCCCNFLNARRATFENLAFINEHREQWHEHHIVVLKDEVIKPKNDHYARDLFIPSFGKGNFQTKSILSFSHLMNVLLYFVGVSSSSGVASHFNMGGDMGEKQQGFSDPQKLDCRKIIMEKYPELKNWTSKDMKERMRIPMLKRNAKDITQKEVDALHQSYMKRVGDPDLAAKKTNEFLEKQDKVKTVFHNPGLATMYRERQERMDQAYLDNKYLKRR